MTTSMLSLLRSRFPTVSLGPVTSYADAGTAVDVFCIPDERIEEFLDFAIDQLPALLDAHRIAPVSLIPHSHSATQFAFPDRCTHYYDACVTAATEFGWERESLTWGHDLIVEAPRDVEPALRSAA